jgi:signal transduction histidine kinase
MHRSSSLPSAAATAPVAAPGAPHVLASRGPPSGNGLAPAGKGAAVSAELAWSRAEDHDRIAQGLNDVVVRRIFAAGLDLHAALALIGDHRGAGKIYHAIGELDQAIRDIRDTIFNGGPRD